MEPMANITRHLRLMLTAITLLCVMALNHRVVTTYASAPEASTSQQLQKSNAGQHATVKQKVSLEATHAYLQLQLAICTDFSGTAFSFPVTPLLSRLGLPNPVAGFFKIFLSAAIQANAP